MAMRLDERRSTITRRWTFAILAWLLRVQSVKVVAEPTSLPRRSVTADAKLLVVVISNETPDFDKDPAILDLALTSFLTTVLRHPFRLRLDLAVYLQCTKILRRYITPCEDGSIDKELSSYVRAVKDTVSVFAQHFYTTHLFCSPRFADAICHARHLLSRDDFIFVLEHDWLLRPSQMQIPFAILLSVLETGRPYILLNRGDRKGELSTTVPFALRSGSYSNNPFFAHGSFIKSLFHNKTRLCRITRVKIWEKVAKDYASRLDFPTFVLGSNITDVTVYHLDGKYFSFAKEHRIGPLFGALKREMSLYYSNSISTSMLVRKIDRRCSQHAYLCSPYFLRTKFVDLVHKFWGRLPEDRAELKRAATAFLGDAQTANWYLEGEIPHFRVEGEQEERQALVEKLRLGPKMRQRFSGKAQRRC